MLNTYRGRLVSKNQMTIPVPMQRELEMVQGDELEFVVDSDSGRVSSVHVLKPVRVELLPDKVLESLKQRKASQSAERVVSQRELKALSEGKELEEEVPTPARAAVGN